MRLVVGLGNPGRKYQNTRHNAGFLVLDHLAQTGDTTLSTKQFGALVAKTLIAHTPAILAKPQSYMNLSGQPVASLCGYYKIDPDALLVVHDDVDLPLGQVRIKQGGGHGGHNGLRNIAQQLSSRAFVRVRVGVSRPPPGWDTADYVLSNWSSAEKESLEPIIERSVRAITAIVDQGVLAAMNQFNTRVTPDTARLS